MNDDRDERLRRHGEHLFKKARELGWVDDGEGPYEFVTRTAYARGMEVAPITDKQVDGLLISGPIRHPRRSLFGDVADSYDDLTGADIERIFHAVLDAIHRERQLQKGES